MESVRVIAFLYNEQPARVTLAEFDPCCRTANVLRLRPRARFSASTAQHESLAPPAPAFALVMKWISYESSELGFQVRILARA